MEVEAVIREVCGRIVQGSLVAHGIAPCCQSVSGPIRCQSGASTVPIRANSTGLVTAS